MPVPKPPYPKAPITEAVIQLNVASDVEDEEQLTVVKRLEKVYPHSKKMTAFEVKIDGTAGTGKIEQQPRGYRLNSDDQADVALVFPNALATARLAPYPGWEALRDRARTNWVEWRRSTPALAVNRIGIRYVNRIDVPITEKQTDFSTYLQFRPLVPDIGQQPMAGYMVQVTMPTENPLWITTITSAVVSPAPLLNHISFLLDIDLFRSDTIPAKEKDLWDQIDATRTLKNKIFEQCITDAARGLFA